MQSIKIHTTFYNTQSVKQALMTDLGFIDMLIEADHLANEIIHQSLVGDGTHKVITIFGMESCNNWHTRFPCHLQGILARGERTMGMEYVKML